MNGKIVYPLSVVEVAVDATRDEESAFRALARVDPDLAIIANADRRGLISSKIQPYIPHFRTMVRKERIAVVHALVRKYEADAMVRHEEVRQDGKTTRAGLEVEVRKYEDDGLTARHFREMEVSVAIAELEYASQSQAVRDYVDGQKYISDNEVIATRIEAEARRDAIIASESIRAQTERGVSRDRLEEAVRVASIDFAKGIRKAEIVRSQNADSKRANIAVAYVEAQTHLMMEHMRIQAARAISQDRLEEVKLEVQGKIIERGFGVIEKGLDRGDETPELEIEGPGGKINIRYRPKQGD